MSFKTILSVALAAIAAFILAFPQTALAADTAQGKQVFDANCAACHAGGKNAVNPAKTLQKTDLEKYAMNSIEAITTQVTNGKAAMPSFKGRLTPEQIDNVAHYVLAQSEQGW
ncbi:MAG: c-type cytochrome [Spirulina sp. SIO3F2]|nr:c-type cytochrome [Spirulina sp. SIO3F2]